MKNYKLESHIGKLNHTSHIIPLARYFLTSLCQLLNIINEWVPQRILDCYIEELKLWTKLIRWFLNWKVPINNIIFDKPMVTLLSYGYKYWIGVYSEKGLAFWWIIPPQFHGVFALTKFPWFFHTKYPGSCFISHNYLYPPSKSLAGKFTYYTSNRV